MGNIILSVLIGILILGGFGFSDVFAQGAPADPGPPADTGGSAITTQIDDLQAQIDSNDTDILSLQGLINLINTTLTGITTSITNLQTDLATEVSNRQAADNLLQTNIDNISTGSHTTDTNAETLCGTGELLDGDGNCQTIPLGGGTVTSVGTGTGLIGGPITATGTVSIDTTIVPQLESANTFTQTQTMPRFGDSDNTGYYVDPNGVSVLNDVRSSIFYDNDNLAFYVDPASTSKLHALDVSNNIQTSSDFKYQTAKTRVVTYGGEEIIPSRDSVKFSVDGTFFGTYITCPSGVCRSVSSMHTIPDGANLINLKCFVRDTHATEDLFCQLSKSSTSANSQQVGSLRSSGNSPDIETLSRDLSHTVDRDLNSYHIEWSNLSACGIHCKIIGAQITYTVSNAGQ